MKKHALTMVLLCLVLFSANCQKNQSSSYNYSNSGDGKLASSHISIRNDDLDLEIKYTGEVRFNEDETSVQSMSPQGALFFRKNKFKLTAESDANGKITYEMYDGSSKLSINDAAGKQFLADAIKELINYGVDAKGSVERLYKKGGITAVLNRTEQLKSDYAKGIYIDHLLANHSASATELQTIAEKTTTLIGSDYEKGKLLGKYAEKFSAEPQSHNAYFAAVSSINSDYEKAKVLKTVLQQTLPPAAYEQAIGITRSINSDYEKANVLKKLIEKGKLEGGAYNKLLDIVALINSDYEKAGVAMRLIEKGIPSGQAYDQFLKVLGHINSDYEQSRVMKKMLEQPIPAQADMDKILALLGNIGSDYEKAGVLKKIATKELNIEQWVSLINATTQVSSNYEKATVLLQIAGQMPKNEKTQAAYQQVAKTVSSDHEYGRVMRALE